MDVEKAIRKELRKNKDLNITSKSLASSVLKKVLKRLVPENKPLHDVVCYSQEEVGAKLLHSLFTNNTTFLEKTCLLATIPYEDLVAYAQRNDIKVLPLALTKEEQKVLSFLEIDDQTKTALRNSALFLQKEYEKRNDRNKKKDTSTKKHAIKKTKSKAKKTT